MICLNLIWGISGRRRIRIPISPRLRGYSSEEPYAELNLKQTRYLQNIAYIRMKNIQLGYTLPKSFISKLRMQNAKVYVSGENLWSWSPFYKYSKDLDVEAVREVLTGI